MMTLDEMWEEMTAREREMILEDAFAYLGLSFAQTLARIERGELEILLDECEEGHDEASDIGF